ncbi:MAG: type II toxin-antitoxin system VapC family toxin [Lentisphaerae bacterium]|jgi:toxin FitB|nr:type II toxin-antitoxin system VapC family toxin [Lentisphaerota bacterium]MBT4823196.1 type II toxin-antitoxin system VapC family toxin [Lentisphaerota bacterium]MBT5605857.1 type II toxin-antitoxin system VapC family toxin [Lentisphaerota bacterium]MBT7055946.1 type II toxin-antitoxin system VapC family toxin [Lentisphaerota bacterium]MBT7841561.1 type II toxin-antitoxin system VapC family toxin [Lentisphaerota bacterium]
MRYLVDANILSEPTKRAPDPGVIAWLRQYEFELAVDPIILGELQFGILLLPRGRRRQRLEAWFSEGIRRIVCLPWDAETGLRWAELLAQLRADGKAMQVKDSMIAATALTHTLAIATRNMSDFTSAGVQLVDPFDGPA